MVDVSVIIPAYNEEKDIGNCLNSLKKQRYKNFEIIVVDDGSTDNTKKIVKIYKNIRLIKGEHKGPGFSRNLGARRARGQILVFVDADMMFRKDYIKNLIKPITKNKEIIGTTHDYEIAVNNENWISRLWGKIRVNKENTEDVKIFRAIRKSKFRKLGGFDPKYGYADDQTFWFKFKIIPKVAENTTCYHKNPETLKGTYKQARWIGASWKERFSIFKIPLFGHIAVIMFVGMFPFIALIKSFKKIDGINFSRRLNFYLYKLSGYSAGVFRAVYFNKVWI